jgi:hypothetical protein
MLDRFANDGSGETTQPPELQWQWHKLSVDDREASERGGLTPRSEGGSHFN